MSNIVATISHKVQAPPTYHITRVCLALQFFLERKVKEHVGWYTSEIVDHEHDLQAEQEGQSDFCGGPNHGECQK